MLRSHLCQGVLEIGPGMALSKTQEAIDSFKAALTLDENNKALKKELLKAERQLVKDIEEAARKEKEEEENADKPPPPAPVVKKTSTVSASATPSASDKSVAAKSEKGDFSKSDHVRGYKVVDGKKTSFFHHEQTE